MSRLDELIQELCPNGVEYKTLGELGFFYGGLTGKSKEDFMDGNAKFISYMNVYSNLALDINLPDKVRIGENENQNQIKLGDVLFTGSSENTEECGMSSVLTVNADEPLYLNSFCFGYRFNDMSMFLPDFSKFLFRSSSLRKQIVRTASGVTRFNVSKKKMEKVKIPVPPLEVQSEIVRILDNFTLLTAELTAELTARKKQYEYYLNNIIKTCSNPTYYHLSDIATIYDGTHSTPNYVSSGIPFISVENINDIYGSKKYITEEAFSKYRIKPKVNDVFMTRIGSIGACAVFDRHEDIAYYVSLALIRPNVSIVTSKYLKYAIESIVGKRELSKRTLHNAVPIKINKGDIGKIKLPIPSVEEQERIVSILDRFDALCNDISIGLPAEIEARQKQYEYYRDKLLAFRHCEEC